MKNKMIPTILLIAAVLTGGVLLSLDGKDAVSVYAQKRDSLLAAEQYNVSFQQVGGRVTGVLVEEGQFVEAGTALITLDASDIDLQMERLTAQIETMDYQIAQAQASVKNYDVNMQRTAVQTARSTLDAAQKNYDRTAALYDEGAVSETAYEDSRLRFTSAENTLAQNLETLQKLENNLTVSGMNVPVLESQKKALEIQMETLLDQKDRMVLKAPVDGTVLRIIPKVGENAAANAPCVVQQSKQLIFDLYVPETKVLDFAVGSSVPVLIVATGEKASGTVQYVVSAPGYTSSRMSRDNSQGDLASFQVRFALDEGAGNLLPGMTVEVRLDGAD
ncbi:MAG: HlyD family efflux transporter periplasmic adaptor subunit [Clostridiales bacterium]|nr:HlyD family efflux transporter periplasmic adaptor subunit [Clostridiales bacterium]